ncbi:MAG TPA: hypothetical protein VGE11_18175 [Pseudonocardia sp.]
MLLSLLIVAWSAQAPGRAAAFGTIDSGGQNREHERITRAALACAGDAGTEPDCFQPRSIDYLAGHDREFGAVGAPDRDELSNPAAHCDNADFLAGSYPRTRDQATASLIDCVNQMRAQLGGSADSAKGLLDERGQVIAGEVSLQPECNPREGEEHRAKCASLEGLGRVLHGAQDFYAHSNWADAADPARPIGDENPPGLNLPGPSPVLDLRSATTPRLPPGLTTGCFVVKDEIPGVGACASRVTHAALNKDRGLIDPATGRTTNPTTPRGKVGDNFAKAVSGAIAETRRQWQDLRSELRAVYGKDKGERMICALTHDDPATDCQGGGWSRVVVILLVAAVVVAVAVGMVVAARRRRRPASPRTG